MNDSSAWRAFEEAEITHSAAHYLLAIFHLRKEQGYARATDVAKYLQVSRGAASKAFALFKERGWIAEDPHRMLELTDKGMELVRNVERNFTVAECFFEEILNIPRDVAQADACKMEHLLSDDTSKALFRLTRVLEHDPQLLALLKSKMAETELECSANVTGTCPLCREYDGCIAEDFEAGLTSSKL